MYYPAATKDYEKYVSASPQDAQLPYPLPPPTGIPVSTTATTFYTETTTQTLPTDPPFPPEKKAKVPWSTGLFGCFSDIKNCCITCWCPCITFGQIAEIVDKGSSSCGVNGALYTLIACVTGCCCCYSCFYRSKMRQQYTLKQKPCWDCLVHCFCEYCALCQEYRELQSRGFDMKIGWHGNVERKNRGVSVPQGQAVAPTVEEGMSRYD